MWPTSRLASQTRQAIRSDTSPAPEIADDAVATVNRPHKSDGILVKVFAIILRSPKRNGTSGEITGLQEKTS